jgi:hypothetical protein
MNTFLDDKIIPATDIVNVLLNKNFWAFSENAVNGHLKICIFGHEK